MRIIDKIALTLLMLVLGCMDVLVVTDFSFFCSHPITTLLIAAINTATIIVLIEEIKKDK